jgi:hypothetical protein
MIGAAVRNTSLTTIGAVCAVLAVACFVAGIAMTAGSGVQVLIPETGKHGLDWIKDVHSAGGLFFVGAWFIILGGLLGIAALVGIYEALRPAGPAMIFGPVLGAVGLTLVTISHLIPIAMAYELVPDYVHADAAAKVSLASTADMFAITSLVLNYTGDVLAWGVVTPLYAFAILRTRVLPRWVGWVGLVAAAFAGWLGLLSPASSVIDGLTFIGFVAFFVFLASMGITLLRRGIAPAVP